MWNFSPYFFFQLFNFCVDFTLKDSADKLQEVLDDRLKVYNNMAAAQMKIEAYDAALKSIDLVLRCQKDNVKAIYRKAKVCFESCFHCLQYRSSSLILSTQILAATMKINEAVALLERALHLDPSSKIIQQDLARLQARRKLEVQKEKSLYKKMFGNDTNTAKTTPQDKAKVKLGVSSPWIASHWPCWFIKLLSLLIGVGTLDSDGRNDCGRYC